MKAMIQKLVREEDGASAVEYGLLVSLIAVVIIAAVTSLGQTIRAKFEEADAGIQ